MDTIRDILEYSTKKTQWKRLLLLSSDIYDNLDRWKNTLLFYDHNVDDALSELNDKEIVLWLSDRVVTIPMIKQIVLYHKEYLFYEITDKEALPDVFSRIADLKLMKWIDKQVTLDRQDIHDAVDYICNHGELDALKWLHERFNLNIHLGLSRTAVHGGNLEILIWVYKRFDDFVMMHHDNDFELAAVLGHLRIVRWLFDKYPIQINLNYLFTEVAKSGHLHVLKWITKTFNVTKESVRKGITNALYWCIADQQLEILKWMTKYFELTRKDIDNENNMIFHSVVKPTRMDKWVIEHFNLHPDAKN